MTMASAALAALAPGVTVEAARRALAAAFRDAGLDTPELDARIFAGHALGLDHGALVAAAARAIDDAQARALSELARRRLAREPVARIVGRKEFWGLPLRISDATLVPRPETETVVEAALAAIDAGGSRRRTLRIADLGTGSGALLLALLSELPDARGVGTDVSIGALATARGNANELGLLARAHIVAGDFGAALAGGFDLVVSNPPYVASDDIAALAPEVRCDPRRALDGGIDGLDAYRAIAREAKRLIAPDGHLVVELGHGQAAAVTTLFTAAGLALSALHPDLSGVPRALCVTVAALTP
jgi:release factor glutamine methyltransferase